MKKFKKFIRHFFGELRETLYAFLRLAVLCAPVYMMFKTRNVTWILLIPVSIAIVLAYDDV